LRFLWRELSCHFTRFQVDLLSLKQFVTLSFWESRDAIVAFAGTDIEAAKYYPEDEKYLLEFESPSSRRSTQAPLLPGVAR